MANSGDPVLSTGLASQNDPNVIMQRAVGGLSAPNVIPFPNTRYDRSVIASDQTPTPIVQAATGSPSLTPTSIDGAAVSTEQHPPASPLNPSSSLADVVAAGGTDQLVGQIITREGGSPAGVSNNPGNIKFAGLPGQMDSGIKAADGGTFASYATPDAGRQAISALITNAARGGSAAYGANPTVGSFMDVYGNTAHQQARQEQLTKTTQDLQKLSERQDQVFEQLNQADPHSKERWDLAKQAMETGREYERKALELAERPPSATPIDSMQKLGGLATLVGILGGLLTKTPLTASLNAGGAAMEAYKANDQEAYKRNMDQFKYHVDALNNYAKFELGIYKDILEDERLTSGERMNRLAHQASILGNEAVQIRAQMGDERATQQLIDSRRQARDALDERIRHDREMEKKGAAGKPARYGTVDYLMQKWHDEFVKPKEQGGQGREPTEKEETEHYKQLKEAERPIGQTGQNIAERIMIGANDVAKTMRAITSLPGGTNLGIFGGAQAALGADMGENVRKALANYATPESTQVLTAFSNGLSRALATLSSAGSAQGVQMLARQLEKDVPQENDKGLTVAAKLADMRQIAEAALEVLPNDPRLSEDQKSQVRDILKQIQTTIPYTTEDVARLVDRNNPERFTQFAQKLGLGGGPPPEATEYLKAHPELRDQFDQKYGAGSAAKALGQ